MMKQYKLLVQIVIAMVLCLVLSGCGRNPTLTQAEAEEMAGVFCLPTYLPTEVDPTPLFYAAGESEIPDATALYKNIKTAERVFIITMESYTYSKALFDPYESCEEDKFILPNGLHVCDKSAQLREPGFEKDIPIEGPSFVTFLDWLVQKDEKLVIYRLMSSLPLEETKKIATSMCSSEE